MANPPIQPAVIASVRAASEAARLGLAPGERVLRVNGKAPRDYIEYRYLIAEESVSLFWEDGQGRRRRARIEKSLDEDLGITFTTDVFDGVRVCRNRCAFCFVHQLPRGMRAALYVKDDDYRLSFLHGNFVTLTNLTEADRRRVARDHLSPLYVSVQATEPDVRERLFGGPTPDPLVEMRRLIPKGIEFHTQIVVCPGLNDGEHLARSVADLAALHPGVRSVGVVPVGLTSHRGKLAKIPPVSGEMAREIVAQVESWQREYRRRLGTRLVFASDETYLRAGLPIPANREYEDFPQVGNGIGGTRLFLDDLAKLKPVDLKRPTRVTLVTGEMAAPFVRALAEKLEMGQNVRVKVCVVPNRFFGESVTTAGLLVGRDVLAALREGGAGEVVVLPGTAIREGEGFLDGMRVEELAAETKSRVLIASTPREVRAMLQRKDAEDAK